MNIKRFIEELSLRVTDAIVIRKRFIGMVDHYVLYMGERNGQPVFVANFMDGVKEVPNNEILKYLLKYQPERVERFIGSEDDRYEALERANQRIGERAYNYLSNNCEHFKNWVHSGEKYSSQVDSVANIGLGTGGTLAVVGLASKNHKAALWGAGLLLLGLGLKGLADRD
jgi:hypothetical protein